MGCGGGRRRSRRSMTMGGCGVPFPYLYPEPVYRDDECCPPHQDTHGHEAERYGRRPEPAGRPDGGAGDSGPRLRPASDVAASLDELRRRQADVEAAEKETEELIQKLRASVTRLKDEMAQYESLAKEAVGRDETQARQYLQRRQAIAEQVAGLESRIGELEQDLERLQRLKADLEIKILEVTAVGHRDRLLQLENDIKGPKR